MLETFYLNLGSRDVLSEEEKTLLQSIVEPGRSFTAGQEIMAEGSRPPCSMLLVDGFAGRYKLMEDGGRQITALHVSGDFVDLHAFLLKTIDHGIIALSDCQVAFADHKALAHVTQTAPHLGRLLWLGTLVDGAIHKEWIVAMGRRSTRSQLAHLICELFVRLDVVNRAEKLSFKLPLSQLEMADVLGISVVHMNRTLQYLRKDQLISWVGHTISILDWGRLVDVAEFDPTYLSLVQEPR